jgi:hypothetical protein
VRFGGGVLLAAPRCGGPEVVDDKLHATGDGVRNPAGRRAVVVHRPGDSNATEDPVLRPSN